MPLMPVSGRPSSRSPGAVDPANEKKATKRRYTLSLSFAGLISSVIIIIIAIGWTFTLGVIIGRGYNPEKQLPELAKLLPAPEEQPVEEQEILKPEELNFMSELKQQTSSSEKTASAQPETKPAAPAVSAATPAPKKEKAASSEVVRSDYVFQVVAYKKRDQADRLRERLEGEGLRTRMNIEKDQKGRPKWFRVQVLLRGTEEDAAEAMDILAGMGIKDPQLLSKKTVKR